MGFVVRVGFGIDLDPNQDKSLQDTFLLHRSPSPLVSRNSTTSASKRSVSADQRRPSRPDLALKPNNADEVLAATKLLVTSTRSSSTPTPLRGNLDSGRGYHVENTKLANQHRWTARIQQANVSLLSKSLSLDCGVEKSNMSFSGNVIKGLHQSMNLDTRRGSVDG
ncbi:hypothetical protein L6452_00749 [Arctium lappa]|uniref:Uncharacterized protein n=1 Tax=Arctium lappa TaxID=4217 RepID=A0ACB9FFL1_ARCLA|nr:hypothetical protein L6452_00749 [Arctium lappa]